MKLLAIKLKLTGTLELIKNPEGCFPNDFEIHDPKVETILKTTAGVSGK